MARRFVRIDFSYVGDVERAVETYGMAEQLINKIKATEGVEFIFSRDAPTEDELNAPRRRVK